MPSSPLLTITKLVPPRIGVESITRERLLARFQQAGDARLALVIGGAGFGKTTLLSQWRKEVMRGGGESVWLTLGRDDVSLQQFHAYLIAGLQAAGIKVDDEPLLLHGEDDAQAVPALGALLVNAFAQSKRDVHVFIDDYHHVADARVNQLVQFLAEHGPQGLCLVIASRARPTLALGKLRVMQQVVELDSQALLFDYPETVAFLNASLGQPCSPSHMRLIHEHTGGWPAGLRLLALASKARPHAPLDLHHLLNKTADLDAYLAEEVLAYLPAPIVEFAEEVAVCRRFCPELAAAITQARDLSMLISALEQGNFIVRLDAVDRHAWFRFHALLAEYLRERLRRRDPERARQLHLKACRWYADQGVFSEAVHHAHGADAPELAIEYIERAGLVGAMSNLGPLLHWMESLPHTLLFSHPRMLLQGCMALMLTARTVQARRWLNQLLASDTQRDPQTTLQATIIQGAVALNQDDSALAVQVLEPVTQQTASAGLWQTLHATVLGTAYVASGRYAEAQQLHEMSSEARLGDDASAIGLLQDSAHALSFLVQGRVNEAARWASQILVRSEEVQGRRSVPANVSAAFAADAYYELNRLDEARNALAERLDLFRYSSPEPMIRAAVCYGRLQRLQRSSRAALSFLVETEQHFRRLHLHRGVAHMLAERAAIALSLGEHAEASRLQQSLETLIGETPSPSGLQAEIPSIAALAHARLAIALHVPQEALTQLDLVAQYAVQTGRERLVVQARLLQAQAFDALGRGSEAADALDAALEGGRSLGLMRTFLDAGTFLHSRLEALRAYPQVPAKLRPYVDALLMGFETVPPARNPSASVQGPVRAESTAPLTPRELDILELMGQSMPNKRIASALGLSIQTVKWNIKNIFGKLGASSRYDAIAWARKHGVSRDSGGDREP